MSAKNFFACSQFAVVGASTNPTKFGHKVLKAYIDGGRTVVGINPNASSIAGAPCLPSLDKLKDPTQTAVSIVTPPAVTLTVLEQAAQLGVQHVWCQPGSEDEAVVERAKSLKIPLIYGGPCVLIDLPKFSPPSNESSL
mmetsp:Transcript_29405/g.57701  ORF Transcript_29405/g.57701 Transcript_29405/m.57701 type:complete len:139 (+) Transcript_29405:46-462(+)